MSDVAPPTSTPYTINTALTRIVPSTADFLNLRLSFDSYYSYFGTTGEGLFVEVSINGSTWITPPVQSYTSDIGIGTRFETRIVDLSAYINQASLRIRFRYAAGWADGVAIDNVRIYGEKPLNTSFSWTAPNVDVFAANCTDPYEPGSSACFRPTLSQVESQEEWTITATATLSNGCDANGTITIPNNSKIWNTTSSTNWNTANWKPGSTPSTFSGAPDNTKCVIIKQPVTISSGLANAAKNITVKSGGSLQIGSGNALTVADFIKNETGNANNLTVASGGSLLQTTTTPNLAANGLMRADRYVTDMDNVANKMDYVYWSSPVAGQNIRSFSVGTPWNRRFEYNQATDYFVPTSNAEFVAGKGYALSAEIPNAETSPEVVNGSYNKTYKFIGIPNNGDISYPIQRTSAANSGAGTGYNLIGNPYPSNINFNELYYGNSSLIYNTAWFWINNTYTQNQQGSGYNGNNYAVYNGTGGNPATYTSTYTGSLVPNGNIQVGQGFIIQKKDVGNGSIQFRNSYATGHDLRVASSGPFFQKNELNNRFWIRMISPNNLVNTQLVGYIDGATNGYEQDYDAEAFDTSSDMFYSVLEGKKLLIQGKDAAFTDEDIVPLGANFFSSGQYRIELENPEGIFVGSQAIYLKDKLLNIYTNLKEGGYVFATNAGLAEGRFEIVYQPNATLGNSESGVSGIQVYRSSGDFVVKSSGSNIKEVEVYDMSGRLIRKIKGHGQEVVVPAQLLNSAGYVLKIFMSDNQIFTRKILK